MSNRVGHLIVCSLLLLWASGCSARLRPTLNCNQIFDERLTSAPLTSVSNEVFSQWIKDNYPTDDLYGVKTGPNFYWKVNGRQYLAMLSTDRGPKIIADLRSEPTVGEVIGCLGLPDAYEAQRMNEIEGKVAFYSIWYPAKGLIFSYRQHAWLGLGLPAAFDFNSVLDGVEVFPPMSKKGFIDRVRMLPLAEQVHHVHD